MAARRGSLSYFVGFITLEHEVAIAHCPPKSKFRSDSESSFSDLIHPNLLCSSPLLKLENSYDFI